MKKWILFVFIIVISVIWIGFDTYKYANEYHQQRSEQARMRAKEIESSLAVTEITFYNGNQPYTIIYGEDADQKEMIICVPASADHEVLVLDPSKGITAEQAVSILKEDRQPVSIKSVNLGVEQNIPIWEIIYINQQNRYTYYYLTFKDGEFIKRYTL